MITEKGSVSVSIIIHKKADVKSITLRHATTKHAPTIGVLERTHATIKTSLKIYSGELRKQLQKYSLLKYSAILNYNITYHTRIKCEAS